MLHSASDPTEVSAAQTHSLFQKRSRRLGKLLIPDLPVTHRGVIPLLVCPASTHHCLEHVLAGQGCATKLPGGGEQILVTALSLAAAQCESEAALSNKAGSYRTSAYAFSVSISVLVRHGDF